MFTSVAAVSISRRALLALVVGRQMRVCAVDKLNELEQKKTTKKKQNRKEIRDKKQLKISSTKLTKKR